MVTETNYPTTIWKFNLEITDEQVLEMPVGSRLLKVDMQQEVPCLWAAVNPEAQKQPVKIRVIGTGHQIPDYKYLTHIDTFQMAGGSLVWHVFQKSEAAKPFQE